MLDYVVIATAQPLSPRHAFQQPFTQKCAMEPAHGAHPPELPYQTHHPLPYAATASATFFVHRVLVDTDTDPLLTQDSEKGSVPTIFTHSHLKDMAVLPALLLRLLGLVRLPNLKNLDILEDHGSYDDSGIHV